jgi:hypothetical protein
VGGDQVKEAMSDQAKEVMVEIMQRKLWWGSGKGSY